MNHSQNNIALGFSFLLFLFLCVFLKASTLWFSFNPSHDDLFFRLALISVVFFMFSYLKEKRSRIYVSLSFGALLIFSFWINSSLLDVSFDGNWYQKEAILQMSKGWNPYLGEPLKNADVPSGEWINYYGKGTWLFGTLIYDTFKKIELGKAFHLISIFAVYFLSVGIFQSFLRRKYLSWIFALTWALNPIAIYQEFTYFVDGFMASLIGCVFLFFFLLFQTNSEIAFAGLICSSVLMISTKATGLVYFLCALGLAAGTAFFYNRKVFKKLIKGFILIGLLSIVISYNPYITSWVRYGSPFYPFNAKYSLAGVTPPGSLIYDHLPEKYKPLNRYQKLFYSLFSESGFKGDPNLKIPFTIKKGEAGLFWNNDFKFGGFGPLFSGALLLSLSFIGFLCRKLKKKDAVLLVYFPFAALLFSTLLNPEACWARYAPQLYFLCPYALTLVLHYFPKRPALAFILCAVLLINSEAILENNLRYEIGLSSGLDKILMDLKGKAIIVDFDIFRALRSRLEEYGIPYTEISGQEAKVYGESHSGMRLGYQMTIFKKIP